MNVKLDSGLNVLRFDNEKLNIEAYDLTDCNVFLIIDTMGKKELNVHLKNTKCNFFVWIENEDKIDLTEKYDIDENSDVVISFVDVFSEELVRNCKAKLLGNNSYCKINCSFLGRGIKKIEIDGINIVGNSSLEMENSSVVLKDTDLELIASGIIDKGAKKSGNFQSTHCLTLGKAKKLNVVPNLFIDENDVEAGHGCTVGDVDDNTMYYLNSRGLSKADVLALIIDSFLVTICDNIHDEELKNEALDKIRKQVKRYVV